MAFSFVELLCRFEPKSVLRFLESYDENYRLKHCLKLCQEYGITDAAAFLLERVGDVASALSLVLADVHKSMQEMDQALAQLVDSPLLTDNFQSTTGIEILDITEVAAVHSVLHVAVALCQHNNFGLQPQESESLWFRLLDRFVEPLHNLNKQMKSSSMRKQHAMKSENSHRAEQERLQGRSSLQWKAWGSDLASKLLRKVLVRFIGDIVNGMMGYVPLPVIMNKILEDHRGHEFGDFRAIILDMLSAYGYEQAILGTTKQLIEDDTFLNIRALKRGSTHAFSPTVFTCSICGRRLDEPGLGGIKSTNTSSPSSSSSSDRLKPKVDEEQRFPPPDVNQLGNRIFPCGHATHLSCVAVHSGSAKRQSMGAGGCPICSYKQKPVDLSGHSKQPSLLEGGVIEVGVGKGKQQDGIYSSKEESMYKTTHQVFGQSRLQVLKHLENGTKLHELGLPLKLNMAPVLIQNKRENVHNSSSARLRGTGRSSLATSMRGDNLVTSQRKLKSRTRH